MCHHSRDRYSRRSLRLLGSCCRFAYFSSVGSGYWPSLNYPYYTQSVAYLQEVFSFIFTLTKPLILLTQTGLPNNCMEP
jgi:hypothetical protein